MRPFRAFALLLLACFALVASAARASATSGAISGQVVDDGGLPIPGVLLTLTSAQLIGGAQQRVADDDGRFTFVELPPGTYTLKAQKQGFGQVTRTGIAVALGRTTPLTVEMKVGVEELTVMESRPAVDAESTTRHGEVFTKEMLSRIPSGRSYQDVVGNTAGVVGGGNPNSAGASSNENTLLLDGVSYGPASPTSPVVPSVFSASNPTGPGNDQYDAIVENPFRVVADTPLSTFSIDVDTASYANVRRFLNEGGSPPRDAVRIEELVNYFEYAYPPPANGEPFATHAEVTDAPWAEGHGLVRIGIQGRVVPADRPPPRNLVFLVDVSGSMDEPDKLPLVQEGLALLADQLGAADHVAMVVYAGSAGVVLPPTPGDRHADIRAAIRRLQAGGSTAGGQGIRLAYDLARRNFQEGAINRVILATDGDFNVGVSSESDLLQLIEAERTSGVFLTVLGVGRGNLQDAKMELLADKGNGNYAYLDGMLEARKVLAEQIGSTLVTIAKDVKIQVEFNPLEVARYRLVGYEDRALADRDFADDTKDAGEIGAGHAVTALYEIVPARLPTAPEVRGLRYQGSRATTDAARSGELLSVHIRYKEPDGDTSRELSFAVRDGGTPFADASGDTRWAAAVAGFGMLLRDSPAAGTLDWDWVRQTARGALGPDAAGYRAEFLGLVEAARRIHPMAVATP